GRVLTAQEARDLVGHGRVIVKPVIDLAQNLAFGGYVAPPGLKEQLGMLNAGACFLPCCDKPARSGDYDHATNYDVNAPPASPGATDTRNGTLLCRFHHRAKTHGGWRVESPVPGTWLWHGPRGDDYLVREGTAIRLG